MALFGKKQDSKTNPDTGVKGVHTKEDLSWVLISPRITEKATDVSAVRAYVFNVSTRANKHQIAHAVRQLYKVTPAKVRVVPVQGKVVRSARTGIYGKTSRGKKAYVYLKEGDNISSL
jgi:large subunit ribosomal protein L23